jgi:hypothetical protein
VPAVESPYTVLSSKFQIYRVRLIAMFFWKVEPISITLRYLLPGYLLQTTPPTNIYKSAALSELISSLISNLQWTVQNVFPKHLNSAVLQHSTGLPKAPY